MVKSSDSGSSLAPFLIKCYDMVADQSTDGIISWSLSNDSFVILDVTEFSRDLLPKYFKHQNFSSFMRQLNIYGFRKVDADRWEFANEGFIKGQKHLLKNIKRRKHLQGTAQKNPQQGQLIGASDEVDYPSLQREVEVLKTDKSALMQELAKLRERHEFSQNKLHLLRERLQGMENNQQQLLSFLVMVMQNPGLLVQLLQPKENSWHLADSEEIALDKGEEQKYNVISDGLIVRYKPQPHNAPSPTRTPVPESGKTVEHDLSFDRVKDFFMNFEFPTSPVDEGLSPENSRPIILPELDLAMLEQFLLSSPSRDDAEEAQLDGEESISAELETEATEYGMRLDKCQPKERNNQTPSLEILTQQLGFLSPGNRS